MAAHGLSLALPQLLDLLRQVLDTQGGPVLCPQGRGLCLRPSIKIGVIAGVGHASSSARRYFSVQALSRPVYTGGSALSYVPRLTNGIARQRAPYRSTSFVVPSSKRIRMHPLGARYIATTRGLSPRNAWQIWVYRVSNVMWA